MASIVEISFEYEINVSHSPELINCNFEFCWKKTCTHDTKGWLGQNFCNIVVLKPLSLS